MKIYQSFLLMLLLTFAGFGQKDGPVTVTGTVTDANHAAIKGVKVVAEIRREGP
jgi:hypothetical protein